MIYSTIYIAGAGFPHARYYSPREPLSQSRRDAWLKIFLYTVKDVPSRHLLFTSNYKLLHTIKHYVIFDYY